MELIDYLTDSFFSKSQLLAHSKMNAEQLCFFQETGVMPQPSYRLNLRMTCASFFGDHQRDHNLEFYAKGYTTWLGMLQELDQPVDAATIFNRRYRAELKRLNQKGFCSQDPKLNSGLEAHLGQEWQHFLEGTYGLCTKSGLPEDIAAKELAIAIIKPWQHRSDLTSSQLEKLSDAVDLLDRASALFAPHERQRSSRHRLVDQVRQSFGFSLPKTDESCLP